MTHERPPLLLVQDLGYTVGGDGVMTPTAVLDVSKHPEIADLARVHAIEGVGDVKTTGRHVPDAGPGGTDLFLVGVSMTSPVRAAFALALPMPEARDFLVDAAQAGRLALATTPVEAVGDERPMWLAIDLDRSALLAALG